MKRSITITPARLSGAVRIMPSKSVSHRAAVCAALAGGGTVRNLGEGEDITATCGALNALGFGCRTAGDTLYGMAPPPPAKNRVVECGESGSTLRLLLPLALDGVPTRFTGRGRLLSRPMKPYEDVFSERGVEFVHAPNHIDVRGELAAGTFSMPGDVSSQFISGLLLALPRLDGNSLITLTTPLQSRSYVELTIRALRAVGVKASFTFFEGKEVLFIEGGQSFRQADIKVEGDYSHAAFWFVAGAIGGGARLRGLDKRSVQGDAAIIDILKLMKGSIGEQREEYHVRPSRLRGARVDVSQTPDIFPILAVAACAAEGETTLVGGARLRLKESDRLSAMANELAALGAEVRETEDSLHIQGRGGLRGGSVSAHADHRIVMSLAVAASICEGEVVIDDAGCVNKSAPDFWREYAAMGGKFSFNGGVS